MTNGKRGTRLAGLLAVMALGVMAFAASAQAVTPQFVFKNKAGTEVAVLLATINASQEETGSLLVSALNLKISCPTFTVVQPGSEILTTTDADANLAFLECKAFELAAGTELPCHVIDPANGQLTILATALALPVEFSTGDFGILFEKIVSTIEFLKETGCPLPLKNVVKGEVCSLIEPATNETTEPLLLFSSTIQAACPERPALESLSTGAGFKDKLLYGANEAFIDSKVKVKLAGAHEGFTLGVLLK